MDDVDQVLAPQIQSLNGLGQVGVALGLALDHLREVRGAPLRVPPASGSNLHRPPRRPEAAQALEGVAVRIVTWAVYLDKKDSRGTKGPFQPACLCSLKNSKMHVSTLFFNREKTLRY